MINVNSTTEAALGACAASSQGVTSRSDLTATRNGAGDPKRADNLSTLGAGISAPASNTGATFSAFAKVPSKTLRFDWMQATVAADAKELADDLAARLAGNLENGKGLMGYAASFVVKRQHETLAKVLFAPKNGGNPHVIVTGAASDEVVPTLRAAWPDHRVTRMDSAQDFTTGNFVQAGGFDTVRAMLLDVAGTKHQVQEIVSVKGGYRSRTVYVGAPASRVRVRLYEKGMMERQNGDETADQGWYRLEAQIRPSGAAARDRAAKLGASESWGQSPLLRRLAADVMGLDVEPVAMQQKRDPDYERALHYLMRQYGPTLDKAIENEGSWQAVGRLLGIVSTDGD